MIGHSRDHTVMHVYLVKTILLTVPCSFQLQPRLLPLQRSIAPSVSYVFQVVILSYCAYFQFGLILYTERTKCG